MSFAYSFRFLRFYLIRSLSQILVASIKVNWQTKRIPDRRKDQRLSRPHYRASRSKDEWSQRPIICVRS